jgi:hypothetical protein
MAAENDPAPSSSPSAPTASALRHLFCGFLAGTANVAVGYPLDTIKVRLQADRGGAAYGGRMLRAGRAVVRAGGWRALYQGMSSPLVGGAAETAVNYAVYGTALEAIARGLEAGGENGAATTTPPPLPAVAAAAAVAGVALSLVLAPVELVKCRLQMSQYSTPAACVRDVLERHGLRGMMRGFGATVAREAPGNAIFFVAYEWTRRQWAAGGEERGGGGNSSSSSEDRRRKEDAANDAPSSSISSAASSLGRATVCGAFAGTAMWLSILPLDVAKTRIQAAHPGSAWDRSLLWHLRELWREGGARSLWAGAKPTVVRAVPANAAQWAVWDCLIRWLDGGGVVAGSGVVAH